MPTKHDKLNLALDQYNIDRNRYRELYYFCKQYRQYKKQLGAIRGGFNTSMGDGMPRAQGGHSDPTAMRAQKAELLQSKIDRIERACICACEDKPAIYPMLLINITDNIRYEDLDVPCARKQFYEARRKVFWILNLDN